MKKHNKVLFLIAGIALSAIMTGFSFDSKDKNDDIFILYTNDVHCGIEENIGYAGLAAYEDSLKKKSEYVTLVDCGDAIQGEFIGIVSEGKYVADIMEKTGYDLAILGNHEFDYGVKQIGEIIDNTDIQYLGCNISYVGKGTNELSGLKPYEIIEYGDTSVGFIGVSTPYTASSSSAVNFTEEGQQVYDFMGGNDGQDLYDCVQKYVDECRGKGADYVVLLTHLGETEEYGPFSSVKLANATEGVDVILDGHNHSVMPSWIEENKNGEEVLISSTGTKLKNIGQLMITADGNITTTLISHYNSKDDEIEAFIDEIQSVYEADLEKVVGVSEVEMSCYSQSGARMVRNRETAIGNFCADAYRSISGADIAFVNGGGIRADIDKGEITYSEIFALHPFGNTLCVVEATGQEILDSLEMFYRNVLFEAEKDGRSVGEDGGFMSISGMKLYIDTSIESSVAVDANDMFVSVEGERRVKNVTVLNPNGIYEPIEADKIYKLASHNYLIKEGGSGCGLFMDNKLVVDNDMPDYQIIEKYIKEELDGKIGTAYSKTGNRIVIK